jgi:hypothetical protein
MHKQDFITAEMLRKILDYCPETGVFTWTQDATRFRGLRAGSENGKGYLRIMIAKRSYSCHRLAWLHFYGVWPTDEVDHINHDGRDNRIANLREATKSLNNANKHRNSRNSTGFKGVIRRADDKAWCALIRVDGRIKHLGSFQDIRDANAAYYAAAVSVYGDFAVAN